MSLVLIVEDNERNLELVRDILQAKGHGTLEARHRRGGPEGRARAAPELILMDIQLPGMSGIEALKALRAEPATAAHTDRGDHRIRHAVGPASRS